MEQPADGEGSIPQLCHLLTCELPGMEARPVADRSAARVSCLQALVFPLGIHLSENGSISCLRAVVL